MATVVIALITEMLFEKSSTLAKLLMHSSNIFQTKKQYIDIAYSGMEVLYIGLNNISMM